MCYEHYHICKYCKQIYTCDLENWICPTVNFDVDAEMCDDCRYKLEETLKEMDKQ